MKCENQAGKRHRGEVTSDCSQAGQSQVPADESVGSYTVDTDDVATGLETSGRSTQGTRRCGTGDGSGVAGGGLECM